MSCTTVRTKAVNFHLTQERRPITFLWKRQCKLEVIFKVLEEKKTATKKDNESSCVRLRNYRVLSIMLFLWSAAGCLNTSVEWAEACKGSKGGPGIRTANERPGARVWSELPLQREAWDAFSGLAWGSQWTICFSTFQCETRTSVTVYYPTSGKQGDHVMWPSRNTYSHILLEFLAKKNRPTCTHVQCHVLTEAMGSVSRPPVAP